MKVYLDNGATTMLDPKVLKAMEPYFVDKYGNASSLHSFGREAKEALERSRRIVARTIRAKPEEIYFTSGGTEADNLAVKGVKGEIITSAIEHPAILKCVEQRKHHLIGVDENGYVNLEELEKKINKNTGLVTIMHANNEIGTIEPIEEITKICREKDVLIHTDAVQSFTKVKLDARKIDMASFSAHKIHGPKGVGAIYIKKGVDVKKQMCGGKQERKMRAGTENIAGIVGFAEAVKLSKERYNKQTAKLRDRLIEGVLNLDDVRLNGPRERLCNNANFSFKYIEGEALGLLLDAKGIASSTGSACSTKDLKPSHVLKAIGLTDEEAHGSIRLTLSRFTTKEEIDYTLDAIEASVKRLRKISPFSGMIKH
jgi:cysteine desulfurase